MLFVVLIWSAKETAFNGLLAARCLSGFASAAGELIEIQLHNQNYANSCWQSIVPSIVSDLIFLHERAAMMSA